MNREQRRRQAKMRAVVPMVRVHDLTLAEAELHAEAMDAWLLQLAELESDDSKLTPQQVWGRDRARQLLAMYQAAIEGRVVPNDSHGERLEPCGEPL